MSLVPYPSVAPFNPYIAAGQFAFENRDAIGKMAKSMFNRKYKKRMPRASKATQAKKKRRGASRIISAEAENVQHRRWVFGSSSASAVLDRKTLAANTLRMVDPPSSNDDLTAAPAMHYFLSGFKLCATFRNVGIEPIHVHMVILQPNLDLATITDISTDMLRDATSATNRNTNFVNAAITPAWDRNQDCSPLNPRKFNILTHQKFILDREVGAGGNDENRAGSNYMHFEKYFPINKKFQYETSSSTDVTKPLWLLIYYETLFPNSSTGLNYLEYNVNHIGYVRNYNN